MASFDHKTYTILKGMSSELAENYRVDCWLIPKKEELWREQLKQILDTAWIKFFAWAKIEKLKELALENNLL